MAMSGERIQSDPEEIRSLFIAATAAVGQLEGALRRWYSDGISDPMLYSPAFEMWLLAVLREVVEVNARLNGIAFNWAHASHVLKQERER